VRDVSQSFAKPIGRVWRQLKQAPEPLIKLVVPVAIEKGGGRVMIDGARYGFRFAENRAYIEVPYDHARQLLAHEHWRADNGALAGDIGVRGA
jgi:hypothetical protein